MKYICFYKFKIIQKIIKKFITQINRQTSLEFGIYKNLLLLLLKYEREKNLT